MFKTIWNKYNNSLFLVLPLFSDIAENVKLSNSKKISYPFLSLCFEYGLENTYLFKEGQEGYQLHLVFNLDVLKDLGITNAYYYAFNERLIWSRHFDTCDRIEDKVIYTLNIPSVYHKDIDAIIEDRHKDVSPLYKAGLRVTFEEIPTSKSPITNLIVAGNIPSFIISKDKRLRKRINDFLFGESDSKEKREYGITADMPHWKPFSREKETLKL